MLTPDWVQAHTKAIANTVRALWYVDVPLAYAACIDVGVHCVCGQGVVGDARLDAVTMPARVRDSSGMGDVMMSRTICRPVSIFICCCQ